MSSVERLREIDMALQKQFRGHTAVKCYRLLLLVFTLTGAHRLSGQENSREYQIKAVFLFNFAQFVEWPTNAFTNSSAPLVIGLLGENPFGTALEEAIRNEKVEGHALAVKVCPNAREAGDCHIVFVGKKMNRDEEVISACKGLPILTVGETPGFAKGGGIIQFSTEKNKVRLSINIGAAKTSHLVVSSKLLRLAEVLGAEEL